MDGRMEVREEGNYNYTYRLRRHHQNDSYVKIGSDETHLYVSLIVRDKVTRL